MRKRLAVIAALLAGIWFVTPTAAAAHIHGRWHGGPPAVGAGTGRLRMPGSEKQAGQGNDRSETHPAAAKPLSPTSPTTLLQQK